MLMKSFYRRRHILLRQRTKFMTQHIVALQKEKGELVDKYRELEKDRDRWMQVDKEDCDNWNRDKKKLTEAKELLNMFLKLHYNPIVDEYTLYNKVEQFLQENK